jgi:putative inorganic carbon (HCO3(-)) transporter
MEKLYTLNPKALWAQLRKEHFSFWMVCGYMILQYFDPMEIYHSLAVLHLDKVVFFLAVLTLPMDPRRRWVRDATNVWMILFWLVLVASSALAIYPALSWKHWFDFFGWMAIYFLIINTVTTPERYFIFLVLFLLANFKLSFFGARTWIKRGFGFTNWGIIGPPGDFQNSADLSIEMLMFAPIAFELAMFVKPRVKRITHWFLMLGAVTGAMTVLGASSRGAQVALAFQGAWVAIQRKLNVKVLIGIALVGWIGYALLPAGEKARFSRAGTDPTSLQRFDYWRAGLKMIEHHPVLGVGFWNFPAVYAAEYPNKLWHGTAQLPHNIFIEVGTDAGLLGLGIFLILIWRNFSLAREIRRRCAQNKNAPPFAPNIARGLVVAAWGFIIAGQFDTVTYYSFLWINLALMVSLANIVRRSEEQTVSVSAAQRALADAGGLAAPPGTAPRGVPVARSPQ